jgi:hypothetical protein
VTCQNTSGIIKGNDPYWQKNVTPIHKHHNQTSNAGKIICIAGDYQNDSDDMVSHHLPVVLPWGFSIEKEHSMNVERYLHKVVQLDYTSEGYVRISCPEVRGQVVVNILI